MKVQELVAPCWDEESRQEMLQMFKWESMVWEFRAVVVQTVDWCVIWRLAHCGELLPAQLPS